MSTKQKARIKKMKFMTVDRSKQYRADPVPVLMGGTGKYEDLPKYSRRSL